MICGAYQLPGGFNLGALVRRQLEEDHIEEKTVFLGRKSPSEWSHMMTGKAPVDLNFLYAFLPTKSLISLLVKVLAQKARDIAAGEIEKVA